MKTHIIIPCYNEAKRLPFATFADYIQTHEDVRFCFSDDGSTDETRGLLEQFAKQQPEGRVIVTGDTVNRGKAEAVRAGANALLKQADVADTCIGFWDADLATPLSEIERFRDILSGTQSCRAVVGERRPGRDVHISRNPIRNIVGRTIRGIVHNYNHVPVPDPICGAKLFTADTAAAIFAEPFLTRWVFDVELFIRMRKRLPAFDFSQVVSLPLLQWNEVPGSKVRFYEGFRILADLIKIQRHYEK